MFVVAWPNWGLLGPLGGASWGQLGASWGPFGANLGPLGASWGPLGGLLGASWGPLGGSRGRWPRQGSRSEGPPETRGHKKVRQSCAKSLVLLMASSCIIMHHLVASCMCMHHHASALSSRCPELSNGPGCLLVFAKDDATNCATCCRPAPFKSCVSKWVPRSHFGAPRPTFLCKT